MNKFKQLLLILMILSFGVNAQTSINTAAQSTKTSSGSIDYTIGQMNYISSSSSEGSISNGIHSDIQILVEDILNVASLEDLDITVYPNPTSQYITLQMPIDNKQWEYNFYDLKGSSLITSEINKNTTTIDLSTVPKGVYNLMIISGSSKKSFKISIIK